MTRPEYNRAYLEAHRDRINAQRRARKAAQPDRIARDLARTEAAATRGERRRSYLDGRRDRDSQLQRAWVAARPGFRSWAHAKDRVTNPNCKDWSEYGGRGIAMCQEWLDSFEAFYAHMGPRPDGRSLDRIDNDGHYEPGNVRWATPQEQARNRRARRKSVAA